MKHIISASHPAYWSTPTVSSQKEMQLQTLRDLTQGDRQFMAELAAEPCSRDSEDFDLFAPCTHSPGTSGNKARDQVWLGELGALGKVK